MGNKLEQEFHRQVDTLLKKGYPEACGMSEVMFLSQISPLLQDLSRVSFDVVDLKRGYIPFVVVISSTLVSVEEMMTLTDRFGKHGITKLIPHTSTDFQILDSISIPKKSVYLLVGVDRGRETLNITPFQAMQKIITEKRSPLTIDEGVAVITQYPDFLMKNNCFSLLGSRHLGDKRVPALWINASNEPHLGWCWENNPHTWLGSASCQMRI